MSIALTTPVEYPQSIEARISGIVVDLPVRRCEVHVQLGHFVGSEFKVFEVRRLGFVDDDVVGTTDFTRLIQDVPEMRQLRRALEDYLNARGFFSGTVT